MKRIICLTVIGLQGFPRVINLIHIFSFRLHIDLRLHIGKPFKPSTAQKDGTAPSLRIKKRHGTAPSLRMKKRHGTAPSLRMKKRHGTAPSLRMKKRHHR